ncbi:anthrax toxin-like adenylyl cyclase domain-containing protein [Pseudomonadota bacterium]
MEPDEIEIVFRSREDGSLIDGLSLEELEDETLMLSQVLGGIAEYVATKGVLVGFRPISRQSTKLLKTGKYVGKGLEIHGKSSPFGKNLCGLVPVDQRFSKLLISETESIADYDQENIDSLELEGVGKTTLKDKKGEQFMELLMKMGIPF